MNNVPHWRVQAAEAEIEAIQPPAVSLEVVAFLEQVFPDKLPDDPRIDEREISYKIGQQSVVKFLRGLSGERS
jgi:hypothetical protein